MDFAGLPMRMLEPVREYFTRNGALEMSASFSADERKQLAEKLARASRKADAAETLWANGHNAEGLTLAVALLALTNDIISVFQNDELGGLERLKVAPHERRRIHDVQGRVTSLEIPSDTLSVTEERVFEDALAAWESVRRAAYPISMEPKRLRISRAARVTAVVVLFAAIPFGWWYKTRIPFGLSAVASGAFDDIAHPSVAIDGDPGTKWLLPDSSAGWLDVRSNPGRTVNSVVLINGINVPWNDRGTNHYRMEIFRGDLLAKTLEGVLPQEQVPVTVRVGESGVTRIRFNVIDYYQRGAGLAELRIE